MNIIGLRGRRLLLAAFLMIAVVLPAVAAPLAQGASGPSYVPNEYIIRVKPGTSLTTVQKTVAQLGASVVQPVALPNAYLIRMGTTNPGTVRGPRATVVGSPWVITDFTPNSYCHATAATSAIPNDLYWDDLWGMKMINMPQAWAYETGSPSVTVAVLDTGVSNHPELAKRLVAGYDYTNNTPGGNNDVDGHGTHVSGTIAAQGDNGEGVVGVCWNGVKIMPVRVLDDTGGGTLQWLLSGLDFAMRNHADVVNMSLGWPSGVSIPILQSKLKELADAGIILCAAAGNDYGLPVGPPAVYDECIAVSAVDPTGAITVYSSYGPGNEVDIAAPGGMSNSVATIGILSTTPLGYVSPSGGTIIDGYTVMSGTSMACPHVAGAAALLLSAGVSRYEVRSRLQDSARQPTGYDRVKYGAGILDLSAAISEGALQLVKPLKGSTVASFPDFKATLRGIDTASISVYLDYALDGEGQPLDIAGETPLIAGNTAGAYLVGTPPNAISFNWADLSPGVPLSAGLHYIYVSAKTQISGVTLSDWGTFWVAGRTISAGQHLFSFPYGMMTTNPDGTVVVNGLPSDLLTDVKTSTPLDFRPTSPNRARLSRWVAPLGYYASYTTQADNTPAFTDKSWLDPTEFLLMPDGINMRSVPTASGFMADDPAKKYQFPAGTGFWLTLDRDAALTETRAEFDSPMGFTMYLYKGWNLIGNPFTHDVALAGIRLNYRGEKPRTLDEDRLSSRPWVSPYFYGYTPGVGYQVVPASKRLLEPYQGYWIKANVGGISLQDSLTMTVQ